SLSDWIRICALINPDLGGIESLIREYKKLFPKSRLADPSKMLAIPAFENQPSDDPTKRIFPPILLDSEKHLLKRAIEGNRIRQSVIGNSSKLYEELYDYLTGCRSEGVDEPFEMKMSDGLRKWVYEVISGGGSKGNKPLNRRGIYLFDLEEPLRSEWS